MVQQVLVELPSEFEQDSAFREGLRAHVTQVLEGDRSIEMGAVDVENPYSLSVGLLSSRGPTAPSALQVQLRAKKAGGDFQVEVDLPDDSVGTSAQRVQIAFGAAWARLTRLRLIDNESDDSLVAALQSPDTSIRNFALSRVADRRLPQAVTPLCKMLAEETDATFVLRGIGALVAIGDANAVLPLTDLAVRKDAAFVVQVAFAIAAIGGRTAEGYLLTLAGGHPDEQVRQAAQSAMDEMIRRRRHTPATNIVRSQP